jgi:hypothetical protein
MAASFRTATTATDPHSTVVLAEARLAIWRAGESGGPRPTICRTTATMALTSATPMSGSQARSPGRRNTAVGLRGYGSGDYVEISDSESASFSQSTSRRRAERGGLDASRPVGLSGPDDATLDSRAGQGLAIRI